MIDTSGEAEPSLGLWLLCAAVAVLLAHVVQGWQRIAQRGAGLRARAPAVLVTAATLGTGLCATTLLSIAAEGLPFPIGYRALGSAAVWIGAMAACLPVTAALAASRSGWVVSGSGAPMAAVAGAIQCGWIWAAGFRPGVVWRRDLAAGAIVILALGLGSAFWVAYSAVSQDSSRRRLWRLGACLLLGAGLLAGQELMLAAAGIADQQGSVYGRELPDTALTLASGALVPLALTLMALHLALRSRGRIRRPGLNPAKRRKRRHRARTL